MQTVKPVHALVLDTGAIIRNEPAVSTLVGQSESLFTVPAIISEIRDAATRSRVETTLLPFLTVRTPAPLSIKIVTDFARRTGDLAVLSKPDIQIIALAYELECERNGGDWRLRRVPGQSRINGPPPPQSANSTGNGEPLTDCAVPVSADPSLEGQEKGSSRPNDSLAEGIVSETLPTPAVQSEDEIRNSLGSTEFPDEPTAAITDALDDVHIDPIHEEVSEKSSAEVHLAYNSGGSRNDNDSDSDGWITPSNLKKRQTEDAGVSITQTAETKVMQVAVLTTDFAMQNVILQMNLNLLSPSLTRVKHLKTFVLRCHACFQITKDMTKQFCPRCGQPTLTRVSCSTNANGEFKLHLKKNMQWNTRGDRYSIPKPVHGSANGRISGGGKGGWGNELMLAEDQKEYERAVKQEKKQKERSLMDEDYLPSILTGDRGRSGGRTKVGAGRNINSKKR